MCITQLMPNAQGSHDAAVSDAYDQYSDFLDCDKAAFQAEFERWQHASKDLGSGTGVFASNSYIEQTLTLCDKTLYPALYTLFRIFGTIPVTSCTAERSFSKLRLLKTHHRSTMQEERLNGLAMLAIRKDIPLDYDAVIEEYSRKYDPRIKLLA